MCRGKQQCTELWTDPTKWSKDAPLMPPKWFWEQADIFAESIKQLINTWIGASLDVLTQIRSDNLREWFCEHGQVSGVIRNKYYNTKQPIIDKNIDRDPLRSPDRYMKEVFERDGYTCQYCSVKVIPKEILALYSRIVGRHNFTPTGTNQERHGIILAFRANADHVVPWTLWGRTDPDNLVTCCWSCNYGKANFTLEEIGIDDPRRFVKTNSNWNGLVEYSHNLQGLLRGR